MKTLKVNRKRRHPRRIVLWSELVAVMLCYAVINVIPDISQFRTPFLAIWVCILEENCCVRKNLLKYCGKPSLLRKFVIIEGQTVVLSKDTS